LIKGAFKPLVGGTLVEAQNPLRVLAKLNGNGASRARQLHPADEAGLPAAMRKEHGL